MMAKSNIEYDTYEVLPWVSHRTFTPQGDIARTVLSNDKDHEFLTLEDKAALAWSLLAEKNISNALDIAESISVSVEDVEMLLADLINANLIAIKGEIISFDKYLNSSSVNLPSSERYHEGGYTEPSPGGSNLDAEFEFQDWALSHGYLWSALWEITFRCNESCVHCFNPGASHMEGQTPNRKTDELSRDEWINLLDEMKELGVFRLLLTGGEVALKKDFYEILDECKKRGFSVTIFTNGTLFDDDQIDRISKNYPHRVELSLYSPRPEIHDKITRLKGSFEKTKLAAQKFKNLGITTAIKMSVMAETIGSVKEFRELCESWGIEPQVDYGMSPGVDGAREPLLNLLPEPLSLIKTAMTPGGPLFVGERGSPKKSSWTERASSPVCGAGRTTMSVSPEGHIYPCNSLPIHAGSVREEGLLETWRASKLGANIESIDSTNLLSKWQSVNGSDYHVCGSFDRCSWCHKCPGMAFLEGGDELAPSTTNCRNAAARMIAYDLIEDGNTPEDISIKDYERLKLKYAENIPLWSPSASIEKRIPIEALRATLKQRTKVSALQKNPSRDISEV